MNEKRNALLASVAPARRRGVELIVKAMEKGREVKKVMAKMEATSETDAVAKFVAAASVAGDKLACKATASSSRRLLLANTCDVVAFVDPDDVNVASMEASLKTAGVSFVVEGMAPFAALSTMDGVDATALRELRDAVVGLRDAAREQTEAGLPSPPPSVPAQGRTPPASPPQSEGYGEVERGDDASSETSVSATLKSTLLVTAGAAGAVGLAVALALRLVGRLRRGSPAASNGASLAMDAARTTRATSIVNPLHSGNA